MRIERSLKKSLDRLRQEGIIPADMSNEEAVNNFNANYEAICNTWRECVPTAREFSDALYDFLRS